MDEISTLVRLFRYKAWANGELLVAVRQFEDEAPARELVLRALNHTYAVDRNLRCEP